MESTIVVLAGVPADRGDRLAEVLIEAGGQSVGNALDQWLEDALVSQGMAASALCTRNPDPVGPELAQRAKALAAQWQKRGGIVVCHAPRVTLFLRQWIQWLPQARFMVTYRAPWVTLDNLYGDHSRNGGELATDPFCHDPQRAVSVVEHYHRELLNFCRDFWDQTAAVNLDAFASKPAVVLDALLGDRQFLPLSSDIRGSVLPGNDDRTWRERAHWLTQHHSKTLALYGELNGVALAPEAIAPLPNPFSESDPAPADQPLRDWASGARSRGLAARAEQFQAQQEYELRSLRQRLKNLELSLDQAQFQRHQAQRYTGQFQARIYQLEPAVQELQAHIEQLQTRYDQQQTLLGTHHTQVQYLTEELLEKQVSEKQATTALERQTRRYGRMKDALATTQSRLNEVQGRLQQAHDALAAMHTSKFWKLRDRWFKLKGAFGMARVQTVDSQLFPHLLAALQMAPIPPLSTLDVDIDVEAEKAVIRATVAAEFSHLNQAHSQVALAMFDREYYLSSQADVAVAMADMRYVDLFIHFLTNGAAEGRDPSPLFNTKYYLEHNPRVEQQVAAGRYNSPFDHFIQTGMAAGLDPCPGFSNAFYLAEYPDVAALVDAGAVSSGFEHYVLHGGVERRLPLPLETLAEQGKVVLGDRRAMFAFISGCAGAPYRYRCEHQAAILESLGYRVELFDVGQYPHAELLERFRVIVMHRVPYHRGLDDMIATAKQKGIRVVFETDDWVFDPEMLHQIEDARGSDDETLLFYGEMMKQFQRSIAVCDGVTVSTPLLKKAVLAQHPAARVAVVPNRISPEMEKLAITALEQERDPQDRDIVRLGYFSGTRTHQDDFDQCVAALAAVMAQFPQVHLRVVGHLAVPDSLAKSFGDRIETLPIVPWQELPKLYRAVDINLAPLNPHVPFTAGKSELKFVEAGIMGVPTVASQWGPYEQAIESGRNGWLCATETDWVEGLTQLIQTPDLRQRLGAAAQATVRDRYLTRTALVDSGQAWGQILAGMPVPEAARSLSVAVVVWSGGELEETPDRWSDWEEGIRALVAALGDQGHDVTVYLQGDPALSHPTLEHRKGVWTQSLSGMVATVDFLEYRRNRPIEADVAIATDWQTAYEVANLETVRFRMHWMGADPTAMTPLGDPQREAKMASVFLPLRPVAIGEDLAAQLLTISGFRNALESVPQPLATAFIESDPQPERHLMPDSLISVLWFDDPATDPAVRAWVLDTLESLQKAYGSAILVQCYGRPIAEVSQTASLESKNSTSNSNSNPELIPESMARAGMSRHQGIQHLGLLDNAEDRAQRFNGAAAIHGAIAHSPRQNTIEAIACGCAALVMGEDASEDPRHASVPYQRSPLGADALYNHLKQLIDEPQRRCDLTKLGAKWAKQFTWERTADATVQVLERLTFLGDGSQVASEDAPTPAEVAN